jgi:endonuclease YncB( thermonuclease family)
MKRVLTIILVLLMPTPGFSFPGRVILVKDGDTVVVDTGDGTLSCRLYGIDAPETA